MSSGADRLTQFADLICLTICETTAQIVAYVADTYHVEYTTAGMRELLKRLGFKKPVLVPGNSDPVMQLEFIEYYEAIKASMREKDKIYFVDGVHPLHNSMPAHGWIRKGVERPLDSNTGRQRVNINGALAP
jgi:calcineurin-like phosphoesterase family protein